MELLHAWSICKKGRNNVQEMHEKYLFLEKFGQFFARFFSSVGQGKGIPKIEFEEIIIFYL